MQPSQLHLTHVTTDPPFLPISPTPTLISRVTELLFHPLVPVHRRSGGIHTTLSPGMIIHTKRAACWPPGMKSLLYRALHGYQSYEYTAKKHTKRKKNISSAGESLVKNQTRSKAC